MIFCKQQTYSSKRQKNAHRAESTNINYLFRSWNWNFAKENKRLKWNAFALQLLLLLLFCCCYKNVNLSCDNIQKHWETDDPFQVQFACQCQNVKCQLLHSTKPQPFKYYFLDPHIFFPASPSKHSRGWQHGDNKGISETYHYRSWMSITQSAVWLLYRIMQHFANSCELIIGFNPFYLNSEMNVYFDNTLINC